ncbi:MAG: acyl-CoA dehydratase activase [bacterium]|nr:acyl-CoA dehydratase activase [bacterium]
MQGIGIDVGSLTTKAVARGEAGVLAQVLLPTGSLPRRAAGEAYRQVVARTDGTGWPVVVTGYGRLDVPFPARRVTEITCHAAGIRLLFPAARTIVDVGGQDSKVIGLDGEGRVRDFAMNDRCAAGTGRFLEVMAGALGVEVGRLASLANASGREITISNLCTVFAESEVISHLAQGVSREDIAAALHRAVARRVHGLAGRVGLEPEVAFTGGVALNQGVTGEFARLVGRPLLLPKEPQFTGALGAALLAGRGPGESP